MNDLTNSQVQKTVQNGIGNLHSSLARLSGSVDNVQRNSQHIDDVLRSVQDLQRSLNNLSTRISNSQFIADQEQLSDMHQRMINIDTRLEKIEIFCDNLYDYMQHRQITRPRPEHETTAS